MRVRKGSRVRLGHRLGHTFLEGGRELMRRRSWIPSHFARSFDTSIKASSHHLVDGLCRFWPWFRLFCKNQKHLVCVPEVILMAFLTEVLGINITGPGSSCKIHQFRLRPLACRVSCHNRHCRCCHWHLALGSPIVQF